MTPAEFRRHGREVIDWIADYMERLEQLPVLSQVAPGEVRGRLPEHPPRQGEPFDAILRDVSEIILPGVTHWQSPNFFAYFPCNNSGPSVLGESAFGWPRSARHALGDQPGLHGAGNARAGLACRGAGSAGAVSFHRRGRWRDSGHGIVRDAVRDPGRAGASG